MSQALCGVLLMALVSVGILGLVLGASVGRSCGWCQSVACVETRWWTCQSTQEPICSYAAFGNGTAHIDCSAVRTTHMTHKSANVNLYRLWIETL